MCIAIYSPINNDLPSKTYLKACFANNPDGAGFAYNTDDGKVKIVKGLMSFDEFYKTLAKYDKRYNLKRRGVLLHCRITTHGGTNKECTHPFPLTSDPETLRKTEVTSDYAVIHNGIISLASAEAYRAVKMSDTMVFISKYLSRIATFKDWFDEPETFPLIYDMIDSKMAILRGDGTIKSTTGFTMDKDGNWYSNQTYKEERKKYTTVTTGYKNYKYDQYDYSYGYGRGWYDDDEYGWDSYGGSYPKKAAKGTGSSEPSKSKTTSFLPGTENDYAKIMSLPVGSYLVCDDGTDFYVAQADYDDLFRFFVTEDGELYCAQFHSPHSLDSETIWCYMDFLGYCDAFDSAFNPMTFHADHKVYKTYLRGGEVK